MWIILVSFSKLLLECTRKRKAPQERGEAKERRYNNLLLLE
uniref:Uncharacterized protein n=1 Tax=Myoviridae sp. ctnjE18 TaxID=2827706 RepID=A0A8S5SUA0_9CAUD|nr:MAG TPA: hypothetical protein [Myoviridae sp. ctnjE18]